MNMKQHLLVITILAGVFFLFGCEQNTNEDSTIVNYEYLSLEDKYSEEIMDWLEDARNTNELHSLSTEEGEEYVYGKGYTQAKVSYTYENLEGLENSMIKATLLKGDSDEEVFIKITHDTYVDVITLDVTDDKSVFYQ